VNGNLSKEEGPRIGRERMDNDKTKNNGETMRGKREEDSIQPLHVYSLPWSG
jgi:hypothetical protein